MLLPRRIGVEGLESSKKEIPIELHSVFVVKLVVKSVKLLGIEEIPVD